MRISDWSSDVCSSDLQSGPVAAELEEAGLSPVEALLLDSSGQPVAWRSLARLIARQDQGRQPKAPEEDSIADATEKLVTGAPRLNARSEEHTSELQSLMRISYAVFCLKKKKN